MARRLFLARLAQWAALPLVAAAGSLEGQTTHKSLKILMKSARGSDDPTKAAFPFSHGLALAEAGHDIRIYLLGEAVVLMRKTLANSVTPVGWPTCRQNAGQAVRQACSNLCLWRVLPRQGRNRSGLEQLWGEVWQSADIRVAN